VQLHARVIKAPPPSQPPPPPLSRRLHSSTAVGKASANQQQQKSRHSTLHNQQPIELFHESSGAANKKNPPRAHFGTICQSRGDWKSTILRVRFDAVVFPVPADVFRPRPRRRLVGPPAPCLTCETTPKPPNHPTTSSRVTFGFEVCEPACE